MSHHESRPHPLLIALALAAVVGGCATADPPATGGPGGGAPRVGGRLPAFTVKAFDGKALKLSAYAGKVLLLDIWASWCAPCKEELPMLDAMAARLGRKGVVVLAVSIDENRDDAVRFLDAHPRPWSLALAHDPEARLAERLAPPKMPTSYIVDRGGTIRQINAGFERGDTETIEARLIALAAESP